MKIHTLPVGSLQTNCYMVYAESSDTCVMIDPGAEADLLLLSARKADKKLEAIFLTHAHFDHVGAVKELAAQTGCKVYICPEDLSLTARLTGGSLHYTDTYAEGDQITAAGLTFQVIQTPGHTGGSVCLLCEDTMFSGDTLFAFSCGRTDLAGGSWAQMRSSLQRLAQIPRDYAVLPGHGEPTRLSVEMQFNPYMR